MSSLAPETGFGGAPDGVDASDTRIFCRGSLVCCLVSSGVFDDNQLPPLCLHLQTLDPLQAASQMEGLNLEIRCAGVDHLADPLWCGLRRVQGCTE